MVSSKFQVSRINRGSIRAFSTTESTSSGEKYPSLESPLELSFAVAKLPVTNEFLYDGLYEEKARISEADGMEWLTPRETVETTLSKSLSSPNP